MTKKKKKKFSLVIGAVILAGILFQLIWFLAAARTADVKEGRTYLEKQANTDLSDIKSSLYEAKWSSFRKKLINEEVSAAAALDDALFLGDEDITGFAAAGILPERQVIAASEDWSRQIDIWKEKAAALQPEFAVLSFAFDSLQKMDDGEESKAVKAYEEAADALLKASPDTKIVINSVLYPASANEESDPVREEIDALNWQIKTLCAKRDWIFVDNDAICIEEETEIYEEDGVHFLEQFYPIWTENIVQALVKAA